MNPDRRLGAQPLRPGLHPLVDQLAEKRVAVLGELGGGLDLHRVHDGIERPHAPAYRRERRAGLG